MTVHIIESPQTSLPPGIELLTTIQRPDEHIQNFAWSPDGSMLASGSDDRAVRIWDMRKGRVLYTLEGHESEVISLLWAPDGQKLCSGSIEEVVVLWDAETGDLLKSFEGYYGNRDTIAWSGDGHVLALGAWNETIHLIDPRTLLHESTLYGHTDRILCLDFSPDDAVLAACGDGNSTIAVWRIEPEILCETSGMADPSDEIGGSGWQLRDTTRFKFLPDTEFRLATCSEDGRSVRVWELDEERFLYVV